MEMYVGFIYFEWYTFQMSQNYSEVNFCKLGTTSLISTVECCLQAEY